jgi:tetratricopeptide (TPR) repeat protein
MIADQVRQFEKSEESEVWTAIDAFEQILDAMPEDRTALETLYQAYSRIGDKSRSIEYLVRLAQVIHEEGDTASIPSIYSALKQEGRVSPSAAAAAEQLETLLANMGMPSPTELQQHHSPGTKGNDISQELKLAWNLMQAGELTQDEYSLIAKDLTENSTKNAQVPVSVLHAIHDRGFTHLDRILTHLSRNTGSPILMLSCFEFDRGTFSLLPNEFSRHKGALTFQQLGNECMAAILNPYNDALKDEVRALLNRRCHFYLVAPADYDAYLERSQQTPRMSQVA